MALALIGHRQSILTGLAGFSALTVFARGRAPRLAAAGLGDLALQLFGHGIQLGPSDAQRLRVVAHHALGGALDALHQILDPRPCALLGIAGLRDHVLAEQIGRGGQRTTVLLALRPLLQLLVEVARHLPAAQQVLLQLLHVAHIVLRHLAEAVIEFAGEQRLGVLGLARHLSGLVDQGLEAFALLRELLGDLLAIGRFRLAQGAATRLLAEIGHALRELLLVAGEVARLGPHRAEVLGKLAGALLAEFIPHRLEIALGASAGRERLADVALRGGLGGALQLLAGLLELLALFRHARLVLGPLHPLLELVRIGEHLLLLLLQAAQLAAEFLALGLGLGLLQGGLQLAQAVVEILLPAGEFLQAVEHLVLLAALGALR